MSLDDLDDKETVRTLAFLARLDVSEEAIESLMAELSAILHWTKQLQEVDTTNIEPIVSICTNKFPCREDAIIDGKCADKVLINAPESINNFFTVPKVVE